MAITIVSGSLPHWDEKFRYVSYLPKDVQGKQTMHPLAKHVTQPFSAAYTGVARQRRLGNLSVDDLMIIVSEAIKDAQGYHVLDPNGHVWRIQMPYARYLKKADPIKNLTTGEMYTVDQVISDTRNDVVLSGVTPPTVTDRLRLDRENEVVMAHSFPRSFVSSQKRETSSDVADQPSSFNDTITFLVKRSQPEGTSKTPFQQATQVLKPRFREEVWDPENPDSLISVESWRFHSIVAFDCWARDNDRAANLLAWFEDFMFRAKWIFELFGLSKIFYWRRDEDEEVYRWRADITKRSVQYLVETERLFFSRSTRVKELRVNVQAKSQPGTVDPADVLADDILIWPEPSSDISVSISHTGT